MAGRKLGRGLKFLLSENAKDLEVAQSEGAHPAAEPAKSEAEDPTRSGPATSEGLLLQLAPLQIQPNPFQPRRNFDEAELTQLADSLRQNGILQPVVVRKHGDSYQLIAGERRLRAAKQAGLAQIPALLRQVEDHDLRLLALVENLQRSDLDPIEKARAFQELKERSGLTHQELAKEVGLERSSVTNYLRLLELPVAVQERLVRKELSMGHARALLAAPPGERARLAVRVSEEGLSVRETERLAREGLERPEHASSSDAAASSSSPEAKSQAPSSKPAWSREMEEQLHKALGCRVRVSFRQGKGRIQLEISSRAEFDRVYELLLDKLPV